MVRRIGWICLAVGLLAMSTESAQAQIFTPRQHAQRPLRYLGLGNGPGYHRCNPGPNVGYYNPWNKHNSFLISKSPQYLSRYSHEFHPSPMDLLYSQQQGFGRGVQPNIYGTVPMNADFVPAANRAKDDDDSDQEDDLDEGFDDSDDDDSMESDDVEDSFEFEADKMDSDEVGGFDSLEESAKGETESGGDFEKSPSDNGAGAGEDFDDDSVLLVPTPRYIPTRFPRK